MQNQSYKLHFDFVQEVVVHASCKSGRRRVGGARNAPWSIPQRQSVVSTSDVTRSGHRQRQRKLHKEGWESRTVWHHHRKFRRLKVQHQHTRMFLLVQALAHPNFPRCTRLRKRKGQRISRRAGVGQNSANSFCGARGISQWYCA